MSGHDPLVPPSGHTPEGGVLLGHADASRGMVLFEDPQCPYCREFEELNGARITAALAAGELAVEYRMRCFLGPESVRADNALALAAEAGRFDELRHELFAAQPPEGTGGFTNEDLLRLGAQVGLSTPDFVSGVQEGRYEQWVQQRESALPSGGSPGHPGRVARRQPDRLRSALRPAGVRGATARRGRLTFERRSPPRALRRVVTSPSRALASWPGPVRPGRARVGRADDARGARGEDLRGSRSSGSSRTTLRPARSCGRRGDPTCGACAVACLLSESSQHPMWPHSAQRRRCSHHPSASRHSTHPVPLGGTSWSTAFVMSAPPATSPTNGRGKADGP